MEAEYIIIQAGGKGSRMERLTRNKPKALVPVDNLPILFHIFKKFPQKKYVIIGDYKFDVLEKYLKTFATISYELVSGAGKQGTCAGLSAAIEKVPEKSPFLLIWCDLVLADDFRLPVKNGNYLGISKDFPCRWKYEDGLFQEEKSQGFGVAGFFIFQDKDVIKGVPDEGEFVRWLRDQDLRFQEIPLYRTHEYGLYSVWEQLPASRCRPFNQIEFQTDRIVKRPLDQQGRDLAIREIRWYKKAEGIVSGNLPRIYSYEPLCMERIDGKNIYEYGERPFDWKKCVLKKIIDCIKGIHLQERVSAEPESFYNAYIGKTFQRLEKIRKLVPFANDAEVIVNGERCRNVFACRPRVEELVMRYIPDSFALIHGDCTFSNLMLKKDDTPVLIDPRGYFGTTELYGDPAYDWVKLYYSIVGNYDQFNLKRFTLQIDPGSVSLEIESSRWEELEQVFFDELEGEVTRPQMLLYLALVWLSLTTYAWEDYDSICGAFYNGLRYFEKALRAFE